VEMVQMGVWKNGKQQESFLAINGTEYETI
jgi:hypothetical protein